MKRFKLFFKGQRAMLLCLASIGLYAGIATSAVAADEPVKEDAAVKKDEAVKKEEPPKQSGSFLVKFRASASDAKIQEVVEYYGANKTSPLNNAESDAHKDPELWQRLKFDAVEDVKNIARRIVMDTRVDEVDDVVVNSK
jgi:hypothetical protein